MRSGVKGKCLKCLPVSFRKALAIAPAIMGVAVSPILSGFSLEGINGVSMLSGTSCIIT